MLYNESDETNICNIHEKEGASLKYYPLFIYNQFKKLHLCKSYSDRVINHLMSILISIFISRYHRKITDFTKNSSCHRTTIAHFLISRKWDGSLLSDTLKQFVIEIIYSEAVHTRKPVFYIVDATIVSKTKPSSRALHTIEDAYFHQSHLKKKTIFWTSGSSSSAVLFSLWLLVYFWKNNQCLCKKGIHTIGALKANHLLYPSGVYRYEGTYNGIENAVVLLSYPEKAFGDPKVLRVFINTNAALSTQEVLSCYVSRWPIEMFFRQCKDKLTRDGYQMRSAQGIKRY